MPWAAAFSNCGARAVPSMAAMMSTLTPWVIIWSICWDWVGMSSLANWRSTSKPASSNWDFTASPSAIQRSVVCVGIDTPTEPPASPAGALALELSIPADVVGSVVLPAPPPPQAVSANARTMPAAAVMNVFIFMWFLLRTSRTLGGARTCVPVK